LLPGTNPNYLLGSNTWTSSMLASLLSMGEYQPYNNYCTQVLSISVVTIERIRGRDSMRESRGDSIRQRGGDSLRQRGGDSMRQRGGDSIRQTV